MKEREKETEQEKNSDYIFQHNYKRFNTTNENPKQSNNPKTITRSLLLPALDRMEDKLSILCNRVESEIKKHASLQRKTDHRQKAQRFCVANNVFRIPTTSFTLQMYDQTIATNKRTGLPGFKGSRLPTTSQFQPPPETSHHYIRSPRLSPTFGIQVSPIVQHERPSTTSMNPQRPATSSRTRSRNPRPSPRNQRLERPQKPQRPASAAPSTHLQKHSPKFLVTSNSPQHELNKSSNVQNLQNPNQPILFIKPTNLTQRDESACVLSRDGVFQQHFRQIQLQVYDRLLVQGMHQQHRAPRFTSPRKKPTTNINDPGDEVLITTNSPEVSISRKKSKNKRKKGPPAFMRVTVKTTRKKTGYHGYRGSNKTKNKKNNNKRNDRNQKISSRMAEKRRLNQIEDEKEVIEDIKERRLHDGEILAAEPWGLEEEEYNRIII